MQIRNNQLSILNIGLDRDLLCSGSLSEAQTRQLFYAHNIPAKLVHIVKAPHGTKRSNIDLDESLIVVPCPVRHWSQYLPASIRLCSKLIKTESFDLIQVQDAFVCGLAGAWLSRRFNLPLVVGLYGDEIDNPIWLAERRLNRLANRIGKWVLFQAAAARSDSMAVVDRLSHYGFRNLTHVPFLITHADKLLEANLQADATRKQLLDQSPGPLLLSVCRLEQEKNVPLMLAAFAEALKRYPGLVLVIAGHGSMADALEREAESLAPGRVRWLGWVTNTAMPAYYQAADLTLLSSNRESAARVLYESLLAGTPALSTDTAGAREVIADGITGRVVPVADLESYSQALIELCGSPQKLKEMGKRGRQLMSSRLTGKAVAEEMRRVYDEALEQAG